MALRRQICSSAVSAIRWLLLQIQRSCREQECAPKSSAQQGGGIGQARSLPRALGAWMTVPRRVVRPALLGRTFTGAALVKEPHRSVVTPNARTRTKTKRSRLCRSWLRNQVNAEGANGELTNR